MKSILIIVPFNNIYPPMNGGMQRCFHIIHQLAKYFDLTLITFQEKESFLKAAEEYPAINNITICSTKEEPKPKDLFSLLPEKFEKAFRYRWVKKNIKETADGSFLQYYLVLKRELVKYKYDAIILENISTLNAIPIIRRYDNKIKIVYDAHNVETKLRAIGVEKYGMKKEYLSGAQTMESSLYKTVDALLTCSSNDRDDFIKMNDHQLLAGVIPNGVSVGNLSDAGVRQDVPMYILFCGALWSPPNNEGLFWFYKAVWPSVTKAFPDLKLLVVGIGELPQDMDELKNDTSLQFTGAVDDVTPWYNKATVAIVPILSGSGTRLKILEAMSLGLPVISTSKGAEGINYTNGKDIIIADKENDFAEGVVHLLKNKEKRLALQNAARKLVQAEYDWNVIGRRMNNFIKNDLLGDG